MDGPADLGASAPKKLDAVEMIDALQSDLQQEKEEPSSKPKRGRKAAKAKAQPQKETKEIATTGGNVQPVSVEKGSQGSKKRPASQKLMKRPAQAQKPMKSLACKKPMKRPAATTKKPPVETLEQKRAKRALLFKQIPKRVQLRWKHGCSKCRGRAFCTVSCWYDRGFTI